MAEKKILIGNFKQNPDTLAKALTLTKEYIALKKANKSIFLGLAAPMIFLPEIKKKYGKSISLYAQNVSPHDGGSHTGEISAGQLTSSGIKNVIIGHSERRHTKSGVGENNESIKKQIENALSKKMNIVLCVGEIERHEDTGHIRFVNEQIETALSYVKKSDLKNITIAYEPVWAIGQNAVRVANENEIYEMAITIRKKLIEMFGKQNGTEVPIIYGGSVNSINCESIMSVHHINGFLIGRSSLDTKELKKIIEIITKK
jgi:triosephosphate isomerase